MKNKKVVTLRKLNLASALSVAIKDQEKYEKEQLNYDRDSALLGGWRDILTAIENGDTINLTD